MRTESQVIANKFFPMLLLRRDVHHTLIDNLKIKATPELTPLWVDNMSAIKSITLSVLFFTGIFALVSLIFYFGDWERFFAVALMGLFVGLVAAPELEPKAFKMGWLWRLAAFSAGCSAIPFPEIRML